LLKINTNTKKTVDYAPIRYGDLLNFMNPSKFGAFIAFTILSTFHGKPLRQFATKNK